MGFVVQRYDAYSTASVYLKLDYGVCNSIRISDHAGKKYLKYRYNIGPFVKWRKTVVDRYERHYFPPDQAKELLIKIRRDRETRQRAYGQVRYRELMEQNRKEKESLKGFWRQAYLVEGGKADVLKDRRDQEDHESQLKTAWPDRGVHRGPLPGAL